MTFGSYVYCNTLSYLVLYYIDQICILSVISYLLSVHYIFRWLTTYVEFERMRVGLSTTL
jgi:hypothetical protein